MTPDTPDPQIQQKLTFSIEYPVVFTDNVFDPENPLLAQTLDRLNENRVHRAMVFVDSNVADLLPQITQHIIQYFEAYSNDIELAEEPRLIPGGEIIKNDIEVLGPMVSAMVEAQLCRHSFVVIVGGGAVLDTVGFAAAIAHRGIRTVRIPTSFVAQATAGVGLKTGINFDQRKDSVGSFAPPFAVISDWQFLYSLPERDWLAGIAEAFRLGLILDGGFFNELCANASTLFQRNADPLKAIIQHCARLYLGQMALQNDPFETATGQPLDFGHWAGHKLEILSGGEISYTEAVAMGVLIDSRYAAEEGWLTEEEFGQIHQAFSQLGLPLWFNELDLTGPDGNLEVFHGIPEFQEHKGGNLAIPFPDGLGSYRMEQIIDLELMDQALNHLKALASSALLSPANGFSS